jgi:hypothetical protein
MDLIAKVVWRVFQKMGSGADDSHESAAATPTLEVPPPASAANDNQLAWPFIPFPEDGCGG